MASEEVLKDAQLGYPSEMAIFTKAVTDVGIASSTFIDYKPASMQYNQNTPLEFNVPGAGASFIDLSETYLKIKCRVVLGDGSPLPEWTPSDIPDSCRVSPSCNFLHSLFDQVDVYYNATLMTSGQTAYGISAYIQSLLFKDLESKNTQMQAELFYKDLAGSVGDPDPISGESHLILNTELM
jgi:hypothetical protein